MDKWMMATVAALGLGLGGCATAPYADGMRYEDGSYYAPARDGYGDYYVAPEPMADPWGDPFFDPFYGPYHDPFWYGPGWSGAYCSARYRYCPSWYDPWFGPGYGGNWGYGGGWGSGFSITIGSGWGGGWYDPWRHRSGGWAPPRHRRPGSGGTPAPSSPDATAGEPRWPAPGAYADEAAPGDADAGDAGHGRPLPRPGRRRAAPEWTSGGWPATGGSPRRSDDGPRRGSDGGRRSDGGGRAERGSSGGSEGGSGERRGRRDRTDP